MILTGSVVLYSFCLILNPLASGLYLKIVVQTEPMALRAIFWGSDITNFYSEYYNLLFFRARGSYYIVITTLDSSCPNTVDLSYFQING